MVRPSRRYNQFTLLVASTPGTLQSVLSTIERSIGTPTAFSSKKTFPGGSLAIRFTDDKLDDREAVLFARYLKRQSRIQAASVERILGTA